MKSNRNFMCFCCCIAIVCHLSGCAAPRLLWPQKDITSSETIILNKDQSVLIASRSSEYKRALVLELHKQLSAANIPQKTIGINDLKEYDSRDYSVIVVINTCLAWGLDHDIESFLKRQESHTNVILMTTSADGAWLPDKLGRDFDAVSGASIITDVEALARVIMARILKKMHQQEEQEKGMAEPTV